MQIRTRMCTSLDGYISRADGMPVQLEDPEWDPEAYGFGELQSECDAVLMGRTTLLPALGADRWPWQGLDVFVLGSERPEGTSDEVVVDGDPKSLLDRIRDANRGGDVHLVGGPSTIQAFSELGAIDELGFLLLPIVVGEGMQLSPSFHPGGRLTLKSERALPGGAVELLYGAP